MLLLLARLEDLDLLLDALKISLLALSFVVDDFELDAEDAALLLSFDREDELDCLLLLALDTCECAASTAKRPGASLEERADEDFDTLEVASFWSFCEAGTRAFEFVVAVLLLLLLLDTFEVTSSICRVLCAFDLLNCRETLDPAFTEASL